MERARWKYNSTTLRYPGAGVAAIKAGMARRVGVAVFLVVRCAAHTIVALSRFKCRRGGAGAHGADQLTRSCNQWDSNSLEARLACAFGGLL
jgi:hypothetical protein